MSTHQDTMRCVLYDPRRVLTCPECFPEAQGVKAGEAELTSCGEGSGGQGFVKEPGPAI